MGTGNINVAPNQGKLLMLLAPIQGARRILEIGTLGGYSTIWLARALSPDGRLITLEIDPTRARVPLENFACAGVAEPRLIATAIQTVGSKGCDGLMIARVVA